MRARVILSFAMNNCVSEAHLWELGESAVADFDRRIASIPPDLCGRFNVEAMRLEDELIRLYKMVVFCVREESDLGKVASFWNLMVGMCDYFAQQLAKLKNAHPACGAESYYDRILDLRNKCHRLQEMHL
jgi:hypothetical protein